MKSASQIVTGNRIDVRITGKGQYKAKCPECSAWRRKKKAKCLSVLVGDQGVRWNCHHCEWHGGEFYGDGDRNAGPHRGKVAGATRYSGGGRRSLWRLYGVGHTQK